MNTNNHGEDKVINGHCNICGADGAFDFDGIREGLREKLLCPSCRSHSRYRSLARGVLRYFANELGVEVNSLKDLLSKKLPRNVNIYDCQPPFMYQNLGYDIPNLLSQHPQINYEYSKLDRKLPLGHKFDEHFTNQNLEKLTFPEKTFDIVITSDVLEHVRNDDRAHREISRVLRPKGVHVFTVPHCYQWEKTLVKVIVHDPEDAEKDEIIGEPEYHGDVNNVEDRALSYRVYGSDIKALLQKFSMNLEYEWTTIPENVIFDSELFYSQKV